MVKLDQGRSWYKGYVGVYISSSHLFPPRNRSRNLVFGKIDGKANAFVRTARRVIDDRAILHRL